MEIVKLGDPKKIWYGTVVCSNCGSELKIKHYDIIRELRDTYNLLDDGKPTPYFICVVCGASNSLMDEKQ